MDLARIDEFGWASATQGHIIRRPIWAGPMLGDLENVAVHTVELLEHALGAARQLGVKVRTEWLSGAGGGGCEIKGQKWIFLDLAQSPLEQLDQVVGALRGDPGLSRLDLPAELKTLLQVRKSA